MHMTKTTQLLLNILNLFAWIIFIGLCIESGGLLVNAMVALFINPMASSHFWGGWNLYALFQYSQTHFLIIIVLLILLSILKSIMFSWIVNLFHKKILNLSSPFNKTLGKFLFNLSYISFGLGLFSYWGNEFSEKLRHTNNSSLSASMQHIKFEGADVWLFMGVIILMFAMIFKKGIELQSENDLTV